jgi:hypothetical protein
MKHFFLLALMLSLAPSAEAASPAVGKFRSFLCASPSRARVGSASLVKVDGRTLVLTSSHVLFHGTNAQGVCHEFISGASRLVLNPIAINALNGLAVLDVVGGSGPSLAPLEISGDSLPGDPTRGCLAGVPFDAVGLPDRCEADVPTRQSPRTILPLVPSVMEVRGHSEYGMSGGAWLDSNGRWDGLVSHQYLAIEAGKPATIHHYDTKPSSTAELVALVIERPFAVSWIRNALSGATEARIAEDLDAQKRGVFVLALGGVLFEERCQVASPVGGIGGDAIGIGGPGTSSGCLIQLSLAPSTTLIQPWPLSEAEPRWLVAAKLQLYGKSQAWITGLNVHGRLVPVSGLMRLLTAFSRGAQPLLRYTQTDLSGLDASGRLVVETGKALVSELARLRTLQGLSADGALLLDEIEVIAREAQEAQFELIDTDQLQRLLSTDPQQTARWSALLEGMDSEGFDTVIQLKSDLLRLRDALAKVTGR